MRRPEATESGRHADHGGRAGSHPHKAAGLGCHAGWGPWGAASARLPKANETGRHDLEAENPVRCKLF